jgi:cardiolipin synthase
MLPTGLLRLRTSRLDLRNHRKIAVIDGRVGYTGSQNLVDAEFKPGLIYEEMVVRVTGPIVLALQYVFMSDWFLETDQFLDSKAVFPDPETPGITVVQALPSGPGFPLPNNQRLMVALVHGARKRVVITTPYLIPDDALLQALQTAVARGVEVHLVLSKQRDQLLVGLAQASYYDELLESGVRIHLYHERFLHAKHASFDDRLAVIGSSNMDIRSFVLNAEILLLFYDEGVATRLRAAQERYFAGSAELTLQEWRQRPRTARFFENLARLLSPLL